MYVCRHGVVHFYHAFFRSALFFVNYVAPRVQLFLHMDTLRINESTHVLPLPLHPVACLGCLSVLLWHHKETKSEGASLFSLTFAARTFYISFSATQIYYI